MSRWVMGIILVSFLLVSCEAQEQGVVVIGNPTPEEVLAENPNADIFMLNDTVYQNAADIDWVNELELTEGEQQGEINKTHVNGAAFENEMATKLPPGSKIYAVVEPTGGPVLIVKNGEETLRYLGLVEG